MACPSLSVPDTQDKRDTPVANHMNTCGFENYDIIDACIVTKIRGHPERTTQQCKTKEKWWIHTINTQSPNGINLDGVKVDTHLCTIVDQIWWWSVITATCIAENVTISFKHEYRRHTLKSCCDVIGDVIIMKIILVDDLHTIFLYLLSNRGYMENCEILTNFQNWRKFEVQVNFFVISVTGS